VQCPATFSKLEFTDIVPESTAFSAIMPGLGFLRDVMTEPFVVHWQIADGWASSAQIPGVRIPGAAFMGVSGVSPSAAKLAEWTAREQRVIDSGGLAFPPDAQGAVPAGPCGLAGLRTLPPRENGGNFDVKQLTKGSKLLLPVAVEGGLFSTGDGHFAQGDGEVCVTAVEMGATVSVRFRVLKGTSAARAMRGPRFSHAGYFAPPEWASPRGFVAAMGMPIRDDGVNEGENLTLACRNALLNMIELLQERGWSREQAYVLCSVAADLRISNVVDVPNYVVSALIPEAIFAS
jgi:formamidase